MLVSNNTGGTNADWLAGNEDFAYARILEQTIRQRQASGTPLAEKETQWLVEAKAALPVPESLVSTMSDYSRDPAKLYAWRNRLGELIERSGLGEVNPWGTNFTVRGGDTGR